jgi:hypothetical protein|tara:strand:+ start:1931 stop:2257 length:327 start_codon:yes stop_codon:yes gene_type:complete
MAGQTRCTAAEKQFRIARCSRMMANGATRSDLVQYAAHTWGISKRQCDEYIAEARKELEEDWNLDRQAFAAVLLSQLNIVHKKALETSNLAVTLGCINSAAKIARLYD